MGQQYLYDFYNPNHFINKEMIKSGFGIDNFRNIKDILDIDMAMFYEDNIDNAIFPNLTSQIWEMALFFRHNLAFLYHKALNGWYLVTYDNAGELNEYWKPKDKVNVHTLSGVYLGQYDYDDLVLVRDNVIDIPPWLSVTEYIKEINHIEDCMNKMLDVSTLPVVIVGNKKQANALNTLAKKLGITNAFIAGDDTLIDQVKSFPIQQNQAILDIYDLKRKYRNECLSSLGIYAVDEKRERIVTQELVNQNDYTDFIYTERVNERKRTIDELNSRANSNIRLVETYDINYNDSAKQKAYADYLQEHAKELGINKADTQVNPDDNKEGKDNV